MIAEDRRTRRGVGNDLAEGTKRMSEKFGGSDFAMHVKGLELSAYDPRGSYAQGVEYATTNRGGCHVQGASMYLESTGPLTINPQNLKLKADIPGRAAEPRLRHQLDGALHLHHLRNDPEARSTRWTRTRFCPSRARRRHSRTAGRFMRHVHVDSRAPR